MGPGMMCLRIGVDGLLGGGCSRRVLFGMSSLFLCGFFSTS